MTNLNCIGEMSLIHASTPFLATSRTCWDTCSPLTSRSLLLSVTRRQRLPSRRVFGRNTSPAIQCSSAMAIDGGSSTSSRESLLYSRAFWVTKSTIYWNVDGGDGSCYLYGSKTANLSVANGEIQDFQILQSFQPDSNTLKSLPYRTVMDIIGGEPLSPT